MCSQHWVIVHFVFCHKHVIAYLGCMLIVSKAAKPLNFNINHLLSGGAVSTPLKQWCLDKMTYILQVTFSSAFPIKKYCIWIKISLLLDIHRVTVLTLYYTLSSIYFILTWINQSTHSHILSWSVLKIFAGWVGVIWLSTIPPTVPANRQSTSHIHLRYPYMTILTNPKQCMKYIGG